MKVLCLLCVLWFLFQLFRVTVMNETLDKFAVICLLLIAIIVNLFSFLRL